MFFLSGLGVRMREAQLLFRCSSVWQIAVVCPPEYGISCVVIQWRDACPCLKLRIRCINIYVNDKLVWGTFNSHTWYQP